MGPLDIQRNLELLIKSSLKLSLATSKSDGHSLSALLKYDLVPDLGNKKSKVSKAETLVRFGNSINE